MSVARRGAAGALQALGEAFVPRGAAMALQDLVEGDGPGGRAGSALMSMCAAVVTASGAHPIAKWVVVGIDITVEYIKWWRGSKRVAQCKLIEGIPEEGGIAYQQQVDRYTFRPYTFRYSHPTDTITGIACTPVDKETQSPEAEVIEGGINHNHATIRLTPVEKGRWACDIAICTKRSSATPAIEADSTHAAAPPVKTTSSAATQEETTRSDAPAAESTSAAAPPSESTRAAAPPSFYPHSAAAPAPTPAVPDNAAPANPATISHWLVLLVVVMLFLIFILILIMMILIIIRA